MAVTASELNIIIKATDAASKVLDDVGTKASGLGGALGGIAKVGAGIAAAGIAAAGTAAVGMGVALADATREAMAAEQVQAQLAAVLGQTGSVTGVTAGLANELANKFSLLTMFDDESILGGEAVLGRFKEIGSTVFPQATDAMLDLATAMGTDVQTAATTLGKALASPGEGLLRLKAAGVVFTDEETKMLQAMTDAGNAAGAQKIILDRLQQSIGTTAEAAGATATGQWTIFNNQIGNVKETIGTAMLPALTSLGTALTTALAKPEVQAAISSLADAIGKLASEALPPLIDFLTNTVIPGMISLAQVLGGGGEGTGLGQAFASVGEYIAPVTEKIAPLVEALTGLWNTISPILIPALQALADIVTNVIVPLFGDQLMTMISTLIGVFTGFVTTITGIIETLAGLFSGDEAKVQAGVQKMSDGVLTIFDSLLTGLEDSLANIVGAIVDAFTQLGIDIVEPVQGVLDAIIAPFESLITTMTEIGTNIVGGISQGITDAGNTLKEAIDYVVGLIPQWVRDILGIGSPSRVMMEYGRNIVEGLIQGMKSIGSGEITGPARQQISKIMLEWEYGFRNVLVYGEATSKDIKERLSGYIKDLAYSPGMKMGDALKRVYDSLLARYKSAESVNRQHLAKAMEQHQGIIDNLVNQYKDAALTEVKSLADMVNTIWGAVSGLGSAAGTRYQKQMIDPLKEQLALLEEQGDETGRIEELKRQIAEHEARVLELQEQQADMQWLTAQMDLLKMIKDYGLNAKDILGGLEFGINADPGAILDTMKRAMDNMLTQMQENIGGMGVALAGAPSLSPAYAMAAATPIQVVYQPVFSAVDQHEAENRIKPIIVNVIRAELSRRGL